MEKGVKPVVVDIDPAMTGNETRESMERKRLFEERTRRPHLQDRPK
jgi:hypothetical protein